MGCGKSEEAREKKKSHVSGWGRGEKYIRERESDQHLRILTEETAWSEGKVPSLFAQASSPLNGLLSKPCDSANSMPLTNSNSHRHSLVIHNTSAMGRMPQISDYSFLAAKPNTDSVLMHIRGDTTTVVSQFIPSPFWKVSIHVGGKIIK